MRVLTLSLTLLALSPAAAAGHGVCPVDTSVHVSAGCPENPSSPDCCDCPVGTRWGSVSAAYRQCKTVQPQFKWSSAGPISGMSCTQISESADPHTWDDNYLCAQLDLGLRWSSAGPISGMSCTQISESADPHTWDDNYLCLPEHSELELRWSSAGPVSGYTCTQISESADPHTWNDNYLCVR